jgi:hypothetical protein
MADVCVRCGGDFDVQEHHIQPRSKGGSNKPENLVPLCRVCHDEIHSDVSQDNPAKFTGDEFWEWVNEYNGGEKEAWGVEYICRGCGYRWKGKPPTERKSSKFPCPRQCMFGDACIEVGSLLIKARDIAKKVQDEDQINYTGYEFDRRRFSESNTWILGQITVWDITSE